MKTFSQPTIKDVAKAAGLSAATISRALNDHPSVTPDTRARVLAAVDKLNYTPDGLARSLRSKQTFTIGLLLRDVSNPNVTSITSAAAKAAATNSYALFSCNSGWSLDTENALLDAIGRRRFAGLLVFAVDEQRSDMEPLLRLGIPVVVIESEFPRFKSRVDAVVSDNYGGAMKAARHFIGLGHQDIGVISGSQQVLPGRDRLAGFLEGASQEGVRVSDSRIQVGLFSETHGYESAVRLLHEPHPPTAIFSGSNQIFRGVLRAMHDLDVCIPEDVCVATFDDCALAQLHRPPITVVARDLSEIGRCAVNLIIRRIEGGPPKHAKRIVVPTRLIIRHSCANRRNTDK